MTIIYPPTIDYKWLYQRPQQLMKEFSRLGIRCIFFNNNNYIKDGQRIAVEDDNLIIVNDKLYPVEYDALVTPPIVLWITYPPHVRLLGKKFRENVVVFDAVDFPSEEFAVWEKDMAEIKRKANIVFTVSRKLYNYMWPHENLHMLKNGADFEHFNKARFIYTHPPKDIPTGKPIVGFIGALSTWLDWDIIRDTVVSNPSYNFVFIGPKYSEFSVPFKAQNAFFLGRKEYIQLPQYLQYMDVCMIPFKITEMTEGSDPIKFFEYMSAGKPVVSTPLPEIISSGLAYIAEDTASFSKMIGRALREKDFNIEKRIEFARKNSWANRAKQAADIIDSYIKNKSRWKIRL
ncbi:glycosyltransferase [Calorimonas adulescens]|jgi:Glycosyl transferases group 1.|uniref:Glycosyltransferase family 1 protein n=1 Tax=Calorimonas adulescens TaxID=2606906 RepID=A0A5D8QHB9_9THEO|nr:glycosyltransferase [Calorimonas adulescens]TZE83594.1 glycosyltransferase family 1 protein [Calorimonas adulescens]